MGERYLDFIGKVRIARPHSYLMKKVGLIGMDMHSHTNFSDGDASVKTLLRLARLRRIGFAITDHNEIRGCLIAGEQKEVMVVPGIELTCKSGREILAYFSRYSELKEFFLKRVYGCGISKEVKLTASNLKWSEEELIQEITEGGGVSAIPHPFTSFNVKPYLNFYEGKEFFKKVIGIEVLNSTLYKETNRAAFYWAKNNGKAYLGGSDNHTRFGLGRALTVTYQTEKIEEFLEFVRKRRTGVVGMELPLIGRIKAGLSVLRNLNYKGVKKSEE